MTMRALLVFVLMMLAGVRTWFFASAYPLFNVSDEDAHYDLICQLSAGHIPPPVPGPMTRDTICDWALFASPEYLNPPGANDVPGVVRLPQPVRDRLVRREATPTSGSLLNPEFGSPPGYYVAGALWRIIGEGLGLQGVHLPYWQRWLHVLLAVALVWLAARVADALGGGGSDARWALPLLTAVFPAEFLYYTTPDALAAVVGAALVTALLAPFGRTPRAGLLWAGGLAAALPLVKLTTVVWVAALPLLAWTVRRDRAVRDRALAAAAGALGGFICFAAVSALAYGDPWGTSEKIRFLTWSEKPVAEWLQHPVFTLPGLSRFVIDTTATFWRGELYWRGGPRPVGGMDVWFVLATWLTLVAAPLWLARAWRGCAPAAGCGAPAPLALPAVLSGLLLWLGSLALLALFSVRFDFGQCHFPSRDYPYMSAGRLMSSVLLPFLAAHVVVFESLLRPLGRWRRLYWIVFACACLANQLVASRAALHSAGNWFNIPHGCPASGPISFGLPDPAGTGP